MTPSSIAFTIRLPSWWRAAWALLHLLVALVLAVWVVSLWSREAWSVLGSAAPLAAVGWLVAMHWRPLSGGALRRVDQHWLLSNPSPRGDEECEGSLSLVVDAGGWMLLRFRPAVAPRPGSGHAWLLLGRGASASDWAGLRRAVYSPRLDPAGPSAQAAAQPPA